MANNYNTGPVNNVQGNTNDINNYVSVYNSAPPELTSITFNVKSPEINFVGRSVMLHSIEDAMKTSLDSCNATSNIIAVVGLGGVGKTQLVRKFIQKNRSSYQHVIWIDSEKSESIDDSFKRLASSELNIPLTNADGQMKESDDIIVQVLNKLCKSKTLCVYDNVDEIETIKFVLTIEPSGSKPHVIITSRIQEWDDEIDVKHLKVWELDEAMNYVSMTLKDQIEAENDKKLLVEKLQHFPLALRQATSYINYQRRERVFRIADYLNKFDASYRDTKGMLDSEIFKKAATNIYEKTTFATWRITIDTIKEYGATGALACRILNIIAYFDSDNILRDIFNHLILSSEHRQAEIRIDFEANIRSAVRLLINYSMVDGIEHQSVLSVHRLVQLVIKLDLTETHQGKPTLRDALNLFAKLIEVEHVKWNESHSHLISVFLSALKFDDLVQEFSALPSIIFKTLLRLKKYNQTTAFGNEILEPLQRILGEDHPQTLATRNDLASLYVGAGQYFDAVRMFEEILEKQKTVLEADHPDTLRTRNDLAFSYAKIGKHLDAIQMNKELLEKREFILGAAHPQTLVTRNNLAASYLNIGRHLDAIQMLEDILEKQKLILEADHPDTLRTRNNIAISYANIGRHSDAIRMYEEILEKQQLILGADHSDTLRTRHNIAFSYANIGNHLDAILMYKEILEKREFILGAGHPETLTTINNLAFSYASIGKHLEAIRMYKEILEKQKEILGAEHPETLVTQHNLAFSCAKIGIHSYAIQKREEVLENANLF